MPILPKVRDPRLITIRRGGTLTDDDHRLLAEWALRCAERVLPLFETARPDDGRARAALDAGWAWTRGELSMFESRQVAFSSNAAAKGLDDPAKFAALSVGQASAVPHVAAHDLGAAAYAIRSRMAAAREAGDDPEAARLAEREWQRERIPDRLRDLVLEDERNRSAICWNVFDD